MDKICVYICSSDILGSWALQSASRTTVIGFEGIKETSGVTLVDE